MSIKRATFLANFLTYVLLIGGAIIMMIPFIWMMSTSFKLPADQYTHNLIQKYSQSITIGLYGRNYPFHAS